MVVPLNSRRVPVRRPMIIVSVLGFVLVLMGHLGSLLLGSTQLSKFEAIIMRQDGQDINNNNLQQQTRSIACPHASTEETLVSRTRSVNTPVETARVKLGDHHFRPDGLLQVNPQGPHPIYELVRRAEKNWDKKMKKASKSLPEAVAEYKHRYRRDPPLGFDHWWSYVEKHNVRLPDEYDQIYEDLEPFWGMDPVDLQEIQREWEGHEDSFTIGKGTLEDPISLVNYSLRGDEEQQMHLAEGAYQVMDLLEDVEMFIPPFRAVFSPHDNPNLHTDLELREMAVAAARSGKYINVNEPPEVKLDGWLAACPPESPAWASRIDWDASPLPKKQKTFIHDHRETMDPCQHPDLFLQHGQFLSHHSGPVPHRKMFPQFSNSVTRLHHDIRVAMPLNWMEDISRSDDPEWESKYDDRLLWRGRTTGIWHHETTSWRRAHRDRLVEWATLGFDANVTVLPSTGDEWEKVGEGTEYRKAKYSPAMLDIAFSGEPISCAPELCDHLRTFFEFRKMQDFKTAGNYKYVFDMDGHGWSSRFKRLMTSNSLIFKATIYPEWFTDRIAPWVHYVPVQVDLSDLYDSLVFFRGDPSGRGSHENMGRKIALAGREWSKTFWRKEDLTAYMFRLFLEYSRVLSTERDTMSFIIS